MQRLSLRPTAWRYAPVLTLPIDDKRNTSLNYVTICLFLLIVNYMQIKKRKLFLLEKIKLARHSRRWKNVLKTMQDSIMICIDSKLVYHNSAFEHMVASFSVPDWGQKVVGALLYNKA